MENKKMKSTIVQYSIRAMIILQCTLLITNCTKNQKVKSEPVMKKETSKQFVFSTEHLKRYKFPTHINDIIIDRVHSSFSEVFMVVIEPDKAPPFHKHDDTEQVFYVVEGTGVLTIGDKKEQYNVKPGDVVRIPPATYHSIRADKTNTLRYLCVDCFGGGKPSEPTWDDHVKVLCNTNGWDYSKVVQEPK
jgi:mannose-6-phosphate isomerase-like protein (cupin superfamily)